MTTRSIEFLFDFVSPYAFFSWMRLKRAAREHNLVVHARPVLLAGLLDHHGNSGPAEIPAKRAFVFRDVLRLAHHAGIALEFPPVFPFNSLLSLRLALPQVAGEQQHKVIDVLWRTGWIRGRDLSRPEVVVSALNESGLDGDAMVAAALSPENKQALRDDTAAAIAAGAFGVPTFFVQGELFWGNDRFDDAVAACNGEKIIDEARVQELLARPGVQRPAVGRITGQG